jgi:RNA polymerase sigma-70 factor (ECF subfamily)
VSDALHATFDAARAAWPGVELAEDLYVAWLCERAPGGATSHASDLYLACACVHGVPRALATFEAALMSRVPAFLARMKPATSVVDEVCQRLRERLLMPSAGRPPRLVEYSGRGPLTAWLCVAAVRTAVDVLRSPAERATAGLDPRDSTLVAGDDPELAYLKDRYRHEVDEALRAGVCALSRQQRAVLKLHVEDGLSLDEIGAMHRVGKSTAFRWVSDARQQLLSEARRFLHDKLGITPGEFASLVNLVRSQLDVNLSSVLASTRGR